MDATGGPMIKQARELGIKATFAFGDGACTSEMTKLAGAAAEGMICSQAGIPTQMASKEFQDAFKAKYGEVKQYAPFFYDAAKILIAAMQQADSTDPAKYLPEIGKIKFDGATGHIEFDEKGDRKDAEMTIFQMKNGNVEPVAIIKAGKTTKVGIEARRLPPRPRRQRRAAAARGGAGDGPGQGRAEEVSVPHRRKRRPSGRRFFAVAQTRARHARRGLPRVGRRCRTRTIPGLDMNRGPDARPDRGGRDPRDPRARAPGESRLDIFLQQMINGLTLGSVYAVVALGYTMVYGIIQLINFAHGEVVMIGAMVAFSVITALAGAHTGLPPLAILVAGVLVAIPVCMGVGYTLERVAYRPLRNAPRLAPLITAIGLSIILQHLAMIIWSRNPIAFPQIITVTPIHLTGNPNGATITNVQVVIIVTSVLMMAGLLALVYRTKLGIAMRATSQNQQVAGLMGININTVIALTFVIGAGARRDGRA